MEIILKRIDEKAIMPTILEDGNSFELTCSSMATGHGRDGRLILEYKTGLEVRIPEGNIGLIVPADNAFGYSLAMTNSIGVITAGESKEIKAYFKTNTDSIPAVYEIGEVFARMIVLPIPAISLFDATAIVDKSIENDGVVEITEEITSDIVSDEQSI